MPPKGYALSGITDIAGARDAPWVMEPHGVASRHWAEQACRVAGYEPDVRYETADLQAHVRLVESGNAVALLPDLIWTGRTSPALRHELPGDPRRTIFTSTRFSAADSPGVRAVRDALAAAAQRLAPETAREDPTGQ